MNLTNIEFGAGSRKKGWRRKDALEWARVRAEALVGLGVKLSNKTDVYKFGPRLEEKDGSNYMRSGLLIELTKRRVPAVT